MSGIKFVHSQNIKIPTSKQYLVAHFLNPSLLLVATILLSNNALLMCPPSVVLAQSVFFEILKLATEFQLRKWATQSSITLLSNDLGKSSMYVYITGGRIRQC